MDERRRSVRIQESWKGRGSNGRDDAPSQQPSFPYARRGLVQSCECAARIFITTRQRSYCKYRQTATLHHHPSQHCFAHNIAFALSHSFEVHKYSPSKTFQSASYLLFHPTGVASIHRTYSYGISCHHYLSSEAQYNTRQSIISISPYFDTLLSSHALRISFHFEGIAIPRV